MACSAAPAGPGATGTGAAGSEATAQKLRAVCAARDCARNCRKRDWRSGDIGVVKVVGRLSKFANFDRFPPFGAISPILQFRRIPPHGQLPDAYPKNAEKTAVKWLSIRLYNSYVLYVITNMCIEERNSLFFCF